VAVIKPETDAHGYTELSDCVNFVHFDSALKPCSIFAPIWWHAMQFLPSCCVKNQIQQVPQMVNTVVFCNQKKLFSAVTSNIFTEYEKCYNILVSYI